MRIKQLLKYNILTNESWIFLILYLVGTLSGTTISITSINNYNPDSTVTGFSITIIGFAIFMFITGLIISKKHTKFLITRSVSRKEIFTANIIFNVIISFFMAFFQIGVILLDNASRYFFGNATSFGGIELDMQTNMSPDMKNIFVFFITSVTIMIFSSMIGYLLGTLLEKWKRPTIATMIPIFIIFFSLFLGVPEFFENAIKAGKFLFTDENFGLIIAAKMTIIAVLFAAVSYPIVKRIEAVKQ